MLERHRLPKLGLELRLVMGDAAGSSGGGGGAVLTPAGKAVIERYRAIEMDTAVAAREHLLALNRVCSK